MRVTIFYSWQSDTPSERGKDFVAVALAEATRRIAEDVTVDLRPEVDQDTTGVPGSPNMSVEIFGKIDHCAVFIADVSLTYRREVGLPKPSPNPNVLIELGYAVKSRGWPRILQVMNTAYGAPDKLPFDLRGHRAITFSLGDDDDPAEIAAYLTDRLEEQLGLIFESAGVQDGPVPPVELDLGYKERSITRDRHEYRLSAKARNPGSKVIDGWVVEVRLPRSVLESNLSYPIVEDASSPEEAVMRWTEQEHSGPIYPDETREIVGLDYYMDHDLYWAKEDTGLFAQPVQVKFFVDGEVVATVSRPFGDLQVF